MFFDAQRPGMRIGPVREVLGQDVHRKRKELPDRRHRVGFAPCRQREIQRQHRQVRRQDAPRPAYDEAGPVGHAAGRQVAQHGPANQVAAEHEEQVDAHPAVPSGAGDVDAVAGQVVQHDDDDREGAQQVEAGRAG